MKKNFFVVASIIFIFPYIVITALGLLLPPQFGDTFLGELKEKCALLENTEGKRIIFVGGSAAAFGTDCSLIEEAFPDYSAINFGMYGGLGTKVMMDLSEKYIHEGDIVILTPEQQEQSLSDYFGGKYMWQAADGYFSILLRLKSENIPQMAGAFPEFVSDKIHYIMEGKPPEPEGVYSRGSFNSYGDIESGLCSGNIMPDGYQPDIPAYYGDIQPEFIKYMNKYAEIINKRGGVLWYRFCPVNTLAVQATEPEKKAAEFYDNLQKYISFPIIGNPSYSIMDERWFYDTNFHLNSSGKTVNTIQIIRDIKAMLGDDSEVNIPFPSMPDKTASGETLYADVYSGNEGIETVEIGAEISRIEDYAFYGCSNLRAIIIRQPDPSLCIVGQHLLDGTNADIYVPDENVNDYRLNYGWTVYSRRIKPLSEWGKRIQ